MEFLLLFGLITGSIATIEVARHQFRKWRKAKKTLRALEQRPNARHDVHNLVDVRTPDGELVATLCVTCDEQLGPEVWQRVMDHELAKLDEPKPWLTEVPSEGEMIARALQTGTPYIPLMPRAPRLSHDIADNIVSKMDDPRYYSPMRSWSADDFRKWDWEPRFALSNFNHGSQLYILPFYRKRPQAANPSVYHLEFHSEAAAHGWWHSNVSYDRYFEQRKKTRRHDGRDYTKIASWGGFELELETPESVRVRKRKEAEARAKKAALRAVRSPKGSFW